MELSPTTELEAVNIMLSTIGEAPVNAITAGLSEANLAKTILTQTSRQVQMRGWYFNTELMQLSPDVDKNLYVPRNALKVDTGYEHIVVRGNRLYDRINNTFSFVGGFRISVVLGLSFDELPEIARYYITVRSSRIFQDRTVGAADLRGFQQEDELQAKLLLEEAEVENGNYNLFDNDELRMMMNRSASSMPHSQRAHLKLEDLVRGR